ncbi:helix-turn-helix transcriptional regulator [Kitasatospora purpeofusca]|uniref:LuxR C-terminal-related transcriptional regulator n=1 Tax=Kitasatospora purpeofusca TaxID=67352 RepID=A0ABZ1U410_9ACTN|nr:LuxR C-terminal-related transcriptional regulator [Kitasatospora purpeofusca]
MTTDDLAGPGTGPVPAVRTTSEVLNAALPDEVARELYLSVLREGGRIRTADVDARDAVALERLVELGLLVPQVLDASYSAVDPRGVADRIGAGVRSMGARLMAEAERLPELMGDLTRAYDAAPCRNDRPAGVRYLTDMEEIRHEIERFSQEYRNEGLTAQPGGARPVALLPDSFDRARRYLERGGSMRTLYEPAARLDGPTVDYAAEVTRLGCVVRVLAVPFKRMLIFDRLVAVIPAAADGSSAAVVEDPATVAFLVDVFEQQWQQAEGVNWAALSAGSAESASPAQDQVGRLLAQGLTQRAIASRLGLSERTVAAHIARLREMYDAETLFQLGWQMRGARTGEPGA